MDNLAVMPTICLVFLYITDLSQILCTHWEAGEDAEFPKGKENQELQTWPPQSRAERKPMWNSLLACLCSTRFLHSCIQFRTQSVRSCSPHSGWIFLYKLKTKIILHSFLHMYAWRMLKDARRGHSVLWILSWAGDSENWTPILWRAANTSISEQSF